MERMAGLSLASDAICWLLQAAEAIGDPSTTVKVVLPFPTR